jgi:large subunit ribosomal protein L3
MSNKPCTVAILGKKVGMTRYFLENGKNIPVTVIEAGPCVVTQVKTSDRHGYSAVQIAFDDMKSRNSTMAMIGHDMKAGSTAKRVHREVRVADDAAANAFQLGQTIGVDALEGTAYVDVVGTSKGKGFAGVMKRHNFKGMCATHGTDRGHGAKIKKGKRMAGHMGDERVTVRSLDVVKIDAEKNLLLVKGPVPGANDGYLFIRAATRLFKRKAKKLGKK